MNAFWQYVGIVTASIIVGVVMLYVMARFGSAYMRMRGNRIVFSAFAAALVLYAGAKHGVTVSEKPTWMTVWTEVDTNDWSAVTFNIGSNGIIPSATPLFIDRAIGGQASTNWIQTVAATWATKPGVVSTASLSPSNPTNYIWRIRCDANPSAIVIADFSAIACVTGRNVTVSFSCPTNLIGKTGYIEFAESHNQDVEVWNILKDIEISTTNVIVIRGNFISRGIDRKFRVRVEDRSFEIGVGE